MLGQTLTFKPATTYARPSVQETGCWHGGSVEFPLVLIQFSVTLLACASVPVTVDTLHKPPGLLSQKK